MSRRLPAPVMMPKLLVPGVKFSFGNPQYGVKDIPKLVGGVTRACTTLAALLYRQVVAQVHEVSSPRVAELAKLYENTFRSVNIALANEMALVCHHLGADVWAAAETPVHALARGLVVHIG